LCPLFASNRVFVWMGHCQSYIAVPFFWTGRLSSIGRKFSNDFARACAHARA
jgi:hypothetical protein